MDAETITAGVIGVKELPTPLVWIEHWPRESTNGGEETFELVVFSQLRGRSESALSGGDENMDRGRCEEAIGRATIEVLVGETAP